MLFTKSRDYHCPEQRSCCPVSSDMFDMTEFYHVMEVEVICATSGSCLKRGHVSFPFFLSFLLASTREEWRWIRRCGNRQRRCIMRMKNPGDSVPVDCELPHWPYVINAKWQGREELASIFLASLIRGFGCSIKPAPIKYTGCKRRCQSKVWGDEINETEMRKRDLKFLQSLASWRKGTSMTKTKQNLKEESVTEEIQQKSWVQMKPHWGNLWSASLSANFPGVKPSF